METLHRELMVIANKAHWQELEVGVKVLLLEESLLERPYQLKIMIKVYG